MIQLIPKGRVEKVSKSEESSAASADQHRTLPQVLLINPKQSLLIKGPSSHSANVHLTLTNPANKLVAFKVKTTAPKRYCVRPNGGLIKPGEMITVNIVYQPGDNNDPAERARHKFLVQAIFVTDDQVQLDQVWREVPKDRLMESKIRCVFEDSEGDGNATEGNSARAEPPAYSAAMERHTSDNDHASVRTTTHVTQADNSATGHTELELRRLGEDYRRSQDEIANLRDENRRLRDNDQRMRKSIQSIGATSSGTSVGSGVGSRHELEVNWKHDLMKVHNLAAIIGALIVGIILSHLLF